jgi:ATP-dependent DNA helicase RecG
LLVGHVNLPWGGLRRRWEEGIAPPDSAEIPDIISGSGTGLIERSGQGVNLMFENAVRQGKALPSFAGTTADEVRLALEGAVQHPDMIRFLERVGADKVNAFSTYDFLVLDHLHRDLPLSDELRTRLPGLVSAGAVEMIGRARGTRYILSRGLYAALGQSGTYTRKAGLDRDTNKALLLKHINRHSSLGSTMKELMQVLPSLGRGQIQVLLRELVATNEVHVRGVTRAGRWYPGPNAPSSNPTGSASNTASEADS